jgi:quercetin dioxygenase-like cupin family protein
MSQILRIVSVIAAGAALVAASPPSSGVTRSDLQRRDLGIPNREAIQARIDIEPGGIAARHTHPGEEIIYVLQGTLQYQVADGPWRSFSAGEVLFIPEGTIHAARNTGSVTGSELATYVVRKGEPLISLAR